MNEKGKYSPATEKLNLLSEVGTNFVPGALEQSLGLAPAADSLKVERAVHACRLRAGPIFGEDS